MVEWMDGRVKKRSSNDSLKESEEAKQAWKWFDIPHHSK
jgi:hypothetical protein